MAACETTYCGGTARRPERLCHDCAGDPTRPARLAAICERRVISVPVLPTSEADEALTGSMRPPAGETRKKPTKEEQAAQDARDRLLVEAGLACWVEALLLAGTRIRAAQRHLRAAIAEVRLAAGSAKGGPLGPDLPLAKYGASLAWTRIKRTHRDITAAARAMGAAHEGE